MTEPHDVERALRRLADRLDAESRPTSVETAMASRPPRRRRSWQPLVAVAAAVVAVLAAVGFVLRDTGDDESVTATEETTSTSAPSTTSPSTTSSVGEAAAWSGPRFEDLPDGGFAVVDGDTADLYGFDGANVGILDGGSDAALTAPGRLALVLRPDNVVEFEPPDVAQSPEGCDGATGGRGTRVALCGGEPQLRERVVEVAPDGSESTLIEAAPGIQDPQGRPMGHWRWAVPSPISGWVLAQWSGECEVPTALLLRTDGPEIRTVDGAADLVDGAESTGIGWTPDGRAVVHFRPAVCGTGVDEPGVYLVDPDSGDRELVLATPSDAASVVLWSGEPYGVNEAEQVLFRAFDHVGLRGCCGEPSHGGQSATSGTEWEGREVPIIGVPSDDPTYELFADRDVTGSRAEIDGVAVFEGTVDSQPFIAFRCGGYDWAVGGNAFSGPVEPVVVRSLTSTLVPYLYCTVDEPPDLGDGG